MTLLLPNLSEKLQLHQEIIIYYTVDGYRAIFLDKDGEEELAAARGETIEACIVNLNREFDKRKKERVN